MNFQQRKEVLVDTGQPESKKQKLIILNIVASKEELDLFGKSLTNVCNELGFKFEPQSKNGQTVYKIVKVQVLGEQQS